MDGKTGLDFALEQKNNEVAGMIAKRMCPKPKITDLIYRKYYNKSRPQIRAAP